MLLHSADCPHILCKPSYIIASNCIVMCSAKYQPRLSLPIYFFWGSVSTRKFNGGGHWAHKAQIFDTTESGVWIVNPKFRLLKHLGNSEGKTVVLLRYFKKRVASCLELQVSVDFQSTQPRSGSPLLLLLAWSPQQELRVLRGLCSGDSPPSLTHPSVSHHPRPYHMVLNGLFATLSVFSIERVELCERF